MTPEQEAKMLALLERIATAAEQQALDTQAVKALIHGWVREFPIHLQDVMAALEKRR